MEIGEIFEGMELGGVLESLAATFSTISSIPAELAQSGVEPPLSIATRGALFSIAFNALINALRHSHASHVRVGLDFERDGLRMSIADDGTGLPDDYATRGQGSRITASTRLSRDAPTKAATSLPTVPWEVETRSTPPSWMTFRRSERMPAFSMMVRKPEDGDPETAARIREAATAYTVSARQADYADADGHKRVGDYRKGVQDIETARQEEEAEE